MVFSLLNYQDDARSHKHKILNIPLTSPPPHPPNNISGFSDEFMVFLALNFRKTQYPWLGLSSEDGDVWRICFDSQQTGLAVICHVLLMQNPTVYAMSLVGWCSSRCNPYYHCFVVINIITRWESTSLTPAVCTGEKNLFSLGQWELLEVTAQKHLPLL